MRLLALVLAFACLAAPARAATSRLDLEPCRVAGETVQCARLEVPEDWRRPGHRRIALKVIVLPKLGQGATDPPMVWLEGGPGVPGTISAPLYTTDLKFHRERRAVVLFDQRGTGESNPLHCPKIESRSPLADIWPADDILACRRNLEAKADLAKYSTEASARDLEALRGALGAEKIDLAALSYGTLLAQAYMKLYPDRVRAAVLIGTVPIGEKLPLHHAANGQRALDLLFADCRADPRCNAAFPGLATDWTGLQQRLARGQIVIETSDGPLRVREGPFNELVRGQLNAVESARRLPALISSAARYDYGPLVALLRAQNPEPEAEGLYLSIVCPEGTRRIREAEIVPATMGASFGRYRIDRQIATCQLWAPARVSPALLTPLETNTPVLLIAGGRDATTPSSWAEQVAAKLPNSRVVGVDDLSHLPVGLSHIDCLDHLMDAFFTKASTEGLDTSCVAGMKPPPFVRSDTAP